MTEEGLATFGLHGANYDIYMKQADEYRDEMKKISAELANDPANKTLIDRRNELLKLQEQSIQSAEDEKNAIKSLVQDGISKELDSLQKLIDKYTDALDSQKDLQDYQRDVSDSAKEIETIRKRLIAYAADDSEESRMTKQKLQNELKDKEKDLQDKEYDKFISDQKELLSDLYDEYDDLLNQRLDNIDELTRETIDSINQNSSLIQTTLKEQANDVGYTITTELQSVFGQDGINGTLSTYSQKFSEVSSQILSVLDSIKVNTANLQSSADQNATKEINDVNANSNPVTGSGSGNNSGTGNTPTPQLQTSASTQGNGKIDVGDKITITSNDAGAWKYSTKEKSKNKLNKMLKKGSTYYVGGYNAKDPFPVHLYSDKARKKPVGWVRTKWLKGYASGTENVDKDQYAVTQEKGLELISAPREGLLTPLKSGGSVFNNEQTRRLWEISKDSSLPTISELKTLKDSDIIPNSISNVMNNNSRNEFNFELNNVNDIIREIQNNKKLRNILQDVTVNRALGLSDLESRYGRNHVR